MANGNGGGEASGERAARLYGLLRPHLDERPRRMLPGPGGAGGGGQAGAAGAGARRRTQEAGRYRSAAGAGADGAGGPGRPRDPVSPLRWTCLSTRNLAGALAKAGHPVSDRTVARLLREQGYSLQGNAKVADGSQQADRDARFRYISDRAGE